MGILRYFVRIGSALSVLINVILGGKSNQTLSARQYDLKKRGKFNLVRIIDLVFFWHPQHCLSSWTNWYIIEKKKYSIETIDNRKD